MPVRLFVGNLPYDATEAELRAHFGTVGPLSHVFLPTDRETGRPRGFAFVEFADPSMATAAVAQLNNQPFRGRTLSVSEARAREGGPGGGGGPRGPSGPPRDWSPRPPGPRPLAGPPAGPAPAGERPNRNFGPDAPRRGKAKPVKHRRDEGPRGPIPVRGGGRIYDVDDYGEAEEAIEIDEPSLAPDDEER
jgi:cold-inducible RNA-binding protein